jgi:hypothetical protein
MNRKVFSAINFYSYSVKICYSWRHVELYPTNVPTKVQIVFSKNTEGFRNKLVLQLIEALSPTIAQMTKPKTRIPSTAKRRTKKRV